MFSALRTLFAAAAVALVLMPLVAAPAPALEFPGAPTRTVPLEVSQGRLVRLETGAELLGAPVGVSLREDGEPGADARGLIAALETVAARLAAAG